MLTHALIGWAILSSAIIVYQRFTLRRDGYCAGWDARERLEQFKAQLFEADLEFTAIHLPPQLHCRIEAEAPAQLGRN